MSSLIDQTRSKIDGLLYTLDGLRAADYPFADASKVLVIIAEEFARIRQDLRDDADPVVAKTLCRRALESIQNYLPVLGFLSRSSDLEAPVELHGPLVRLTRRAIQSDALLVIFSEWDYSPFTFLFPGLTKRGVVLVGMPRSEAHNPLIAPLAGHELGHNIWHRAKLGAGYESAAGKIIVEEMTDNWEHRWKRLLSLDKPEQLSDLVGLRFWELPLAWAVRQAEETFCDLVGLFIFREAYLHAFKYLLAPGDSVRRVYHYPDLARRAKFLSESGAKMGVKVPANYVDSFDKTSPRVDDELMLQYVSLADIACVRLIDQLLADASRLGGEGKLSSYSTAEVERAKAALNQAVPVTGATGIENILIAAWEHELDMKGFLGKHLPSVRPGDKKTVLHELVLKSFEVFEVEQRLAA
jgi:hypothetical protein